VNLRALANRATKRINPNLPAQVQVSTGYTQDANYNRVPAYADPVDALVQMQALTKKEIEHLDAINIAGTEVAAYINLQLSSVDRTTQSGGDIILFGSDTAIPDTLKGTKWWVTAVLEAWSIGGWCKVGLTRQLP
jgi:hypothetical protein